MASDLFSEETFMVRELSPEHDLPAWLELIRTLEIEQTGQAQRTEEQLRKALTRPRFRRWVITAPGDPRKLVGYGMLYAQIKERSALDVNVHPDWRHRGLGSMLLERLLEDARSIAADWANVEIEVGNSAGISFLVHHGFRQFSDAWLLHAPAETQFREPVWPAGFEARSYADGISLEMFVEAANRSYGDLWGHDENTAGGTQVEDVRRMLANFDPRDVFVLFSAEGRPAGVTRVEPAVRTGGQVDILDGPSVAPELRSQHLQRELALHALAWLRKQGQHAVQLESWGDTRETIALYEAIGFQVAEHYLAYRKDLQRLR